MKKKKSLDELLVEQAIEPGTDDSIRNFALFLDWWEEIKTSYEKGWSYKNIWMTLKREGSFTFSYSAFCNYVRKMKRREVLIEKEKLKIKQEGGMRVNHGVVPGAVASSGNSSPTKVDLPLFGSKRQPGARPKF